MQKCFIIGSPRKFKNCHLPLIFRLLIFRFFSVRLFSVRLFGKIFIFFGFVSFPIFMCYFDENYLNWRFFFLWSADGECSNKDGMMKVNCGRVKNVDDFFFGGRFLRTRIYSNVRVFFSKYFGFCESGLQNRANLVR